MPGIQVSGDRPGVGKTNLAAALLLRAASRGRSPGYYKPFTMSHDGDPDVAFVSRHLLPGQADVPAPIPLPASSGPGQAEALSGQLTGTSGLAGADPVIVEGTDLASPAGQAWRLPGLTAEALGCRIVLVVGFSSRMSIPAIVADIEHLRDRLAGVVVNGVTAYRARETSQGFIAGLQAAGIPVLGAIPEDRAMLAVTVEQVAAHLGGDWVQEPENTDSLIERFLIGGNILDSGETYYGRYSNQAVIVRAERPDIQLASLMEDTACLVLTGRGDPTEYIKAEAMQRSVPLIRVEQDTIPTAESLAGLLDKATPHSAAKVSRFAELMQEHLDVLALDGLL